MPHDFCCIFSSNTTIFCHENCHLHFMSAAYIQVHFRLDFYVEANNVDPDQTALKQSDLGPYCLLYRLPQNLRGEEQTLRALTTAN